MASKSMPPPSLKLMKSQYLERETWCKTSGELLKATFKWTIENFTIKSNGMKKGQSLFSDTFHVPEDDQVLWKLNLYTKGGPKDEDNEWVSLFLVLVPGKKPESSTQFSLSFWSPKLEKEIMKANSVQKFDRSCGKIRFLKKSGIQDQLDADGSLLLICRLEYEAECTTKITSSCNLPSLMQRPPSNAINNLQYLFSSKQNSDVTFRVGGQDFLAHKLIVSIRSPVFADMFQDDPKEEQIIKLEQVEPAIFQKMLIFIYTDQLEDLTEESAKSLLILGARFQLELLKYGCQEFLAQQCLKVVNSLELLVFADFHDAKHLKKMALAFIRQHYGEVAKTSNFKTELKKGRPELFQDIRRAIIDKPCDSADPAQESCENLKIS